MPIKHYDWQPTILLHLTHLILILIAGRSVRLFIGHLVQWYLPSGSLGSGALQVRYTHHLTESAHPQAEGRSFLESVEETSVVLLQATLTVRQQFVLVLRY